MPREDRDNWSDRATFDEFIDEGLAAGIGAGERERSRRAAVAREVRQEDTQVLIREALREIEHDALVGGEAVEEDDVALRLTRDGLDDVNAHVAARGGSDDGFRAVGLLTDEQDTDGKEGAASKSEDEFFASGQDREIFCHRGKERCASRRREEKTYRRGSRGDAPGRETARKNSAW